MPDFSSPSLNLNTFHYNAVLAFFALTVHLFPFLIPVQSICLDRDLSKLSTLILYAQRNSLAVSVIVMFVDCQHFRAQLEILVLIFHQ